MAQGSGLGTVVKFGLIGLAGWWVYETFFAPASAPSSGAQAPPVGSPSTSTGTVTQPGAAVTGAAPTATLSPTSQQTLNAIYQRILQLASSDPSVVNGQAPVSVWNYWTQQATGLPNQGGYAPGAPADPQLMTASQYWAYAQPVIGKLSGLSGLLSGLRGMRGLTPAPMWQGTAIRPGYLS